MKPISEIFISKFNKAATGWLLSKKNLVKHVGSRSDFIEMNRDEYVVVRLNNLSHSYAQKYLLSDPDRYCENFLTEFRPALRAFLEELRISNYIYVFLFSGNGFRGTRFVF